MKYLKIYENNKYNVGDYVKYINYSIDVNLDENLIFKIDIINNDPQTNYFRPYHLTYTDPELGILHAFWAKEKQIYTDEETEFISNQNKYNL